MVDGNNTLYCRASGLEWYYNGTTGNMEGHSPQFDVLISDQDAQNMKAELDALWSVSVDAQLTGKP